MAVCGDPEIQLPAPGDDPGFEERVAAAPLERQRDLLRAADLLRSASDPTDPDGDDRGARADRAYLALLAVLDPSSPEGMERAEWLLSRRTYVRVADGALYRLLGADARDPSRRRFARARSGQVAALEGDRADAETIFMEVLEDRTVEDSAALIARFQMAYIALARGNWPEALAAYRGVARIARRLGNFRTEAMAQIHRCMMFGELRAWRQFDDALEKAHTLVDALEVGSVGAEHARLILLECLVKAANLRADYTVALAHLDELDKLCHEYLDDNVGAISRSTARAEALIGLGRQDEALVPLAEAAPHVVPFTTGWFVYSVWKALALAASGNAGEAHALALEVVDQLQTRGSEAQAELGLVRCANHADMMARVLQDTCGDTDAARRAWDVAGSTLLARTLELDLQLRMRPQSLESNLAELDAMQCHREFVTQTRGQVLAAVSRALDAAAREGGPDLLRHLAKPGHGMTVCAWCGRLKTPDERWIPALSFLPDDEVTGPRPLNHGICEDCLAKTGA